MEWQPIETAPKDGTRILVYTTGRWWRDGWSNNNDWGRRNEKPQVMEVEWWEGWYLNKQAGWMIANCDEEYGMLVEATHWMPLPKPPVSRETLGE